MKRSPVEFRNLDEAFDAWNAIRERKSAREKVRAVIGTVENHLGSIQRIYIPESQGYIGVQFSNQPNQVGAYIGRNHIDHTVELDGSRQREDAPGYWRTIINNEFAKKANLPTWEPRKDSEARKASAGAVVSALLGARAEISPSHLKELLSIAIWKHTECDGKYTTRYRSLGAIERPNEKLNHEHVVPRKLLVEAMLETPHRFSEILESAIGCTVLEEEHKTIMKMEKVQKGLLGWDRYRAAEVVVYDLHTGERVV